MALIWHAINIAFSEFIQKYVSGPVQVLIQVDKSGQVGLFQKLISTVRPWDARFLGNGKIRETLGI